MTVDSDGTFRFLTDEEILALILAFLFVVVLSILIIKISLKWRLLYSGRLFYCVTFTESHTVGTASFFLAHFFKCTKISS